MTITKTLTIVAIHGELEPTEDADHNPRDCDVVILAKDVDGNAAEIHVADWTEAAQLKGATQVVISIDAA